MAEEERKQEIKKEVKEYIKDKIEENEENEESDRKKKFNTILKKFKDIHNENEGVKEIDYDLKLKKKFNLVINELEKNNIDKKSKNEFIKYMIKELIEMIN